MVVINKWLLNHFSVDKEGIASWIQYLLMLLVFLVGGRQGHGDTL